MKRTFSKEQISLQIGLFIRCTRAYSLPMSFVAWLIPFVFGIYAQGNIFYGLLTYVGIAFAHLGSNMFDDFIDYRRHLREDNPLQKGKCSYFINDEISQKNFLLLMGVCLGIAILIGLFFIYTHKMPIVLLMIVTGILCLIYPKSSYFGTGELIIGVIFSPLVFTGVYYVMTSSYSAELLWLSISFAIVAVILLYAHSFLDFNYDVSDKKKTLCVLCDDKEGAYKLLVFLIFLIYFFIFAGIILNILTPAYLLTFISGISGLSLCKSLQKYIDEEPKDEAEFLSVFNKAQKFTMIFAVMTILSGFVAKL